MAETTADTAERRIYELGYHIIPSVGDEHVAAEVAALKTMLEEHGGVFIMEEYPVPTTLSYPVKISRHGKRETHQSGYFGWVKFELEPGELPEVKEALRHNENLLRHLLITTVREDTRVPKRVFQKPHEAAKAAPEEAAKEVPAKLSEEALDRSIAGIVVE